MSYNTYRIHYLLFLDYHFEQKRAKFNIWDPELRVQMYQEVSVLLNTACSRALRNVSANYGA